MMMKQNRVTVHDRETQQQFLTVVEIPVVQYAIC